MGQFPNNFYAEENILFLKFCLQCVDIFRVDTTKEHKIKNFEKKSSKKSFQLKQKTITKVVEM